MEFAQVQQMRDPSTASSRIYVGNLLEGVTSPDLTAHFAKYGNIRGVLINRGFGFIQFDKEGSANTAIQGENNGKFQGRKIVVRNAVKNPANPTGGVPPPVQKSQIIIEPDGTVKPQDLNRTARQMFAKRVKRGGGGGNMMDNERDRSPLGGGGGAGDGTDQDQRWGNQNQNNFNMGPGGGNNFGNRFPPQQQHQQMSSMAPQRMQQNHCEIIVVHKLLTQYAEAIEERLRRMGLAVDLLFPNEDVPIGKVLANIASRGCLYAILVLPINQEHRSITVNILHGDPTEHRNMPVQDALDMLSIDFQNVSQHLERSQRFPMQGGAPRMMPTAVEITPTSAYAAPPLNTRHPEAIQTLVNLLADNRPITVLQYDRVVKYLQERREYQLKAEIGDAPPDIPIPPPVDPEVELQKKIMDILNKPSITTTSAAAVAPKPVPQPSVVETVSSVLKPNAGRSTSSNNTSATGGGGGQPKLLNDPKVQKALDSLLSGSLFNF